MEASASAIAPGAVIGARYRLERLRGEGGMGVVWEATSLATGERVAVKLMRERERGEAGEGEGRDAHGRRRFLREARAAAAVRHPSVVRVLEVLDAAGEPPAIAMELLEGESLRERLDRQGRLSLAEAASVLVPVASAVGAAHALGIVHCDLKPENVFLARGDAGAARVKVLDFGLAELTARGGEAMRSTGLSTGAIVGTPAYMAPEQVFAEQDLDPRADVWALGVILYECLAGERPTAGESVGQILKHVLAQPFAALDARVPGVPPAVARLVGRMLERERARRPRDLREVLEVLAPFARELAPPPARRPPDRRGRRPRRHAS